MRPSAANVAPVSACDHILASRLLSEEETARGMIAQVADLAAVAFEVLAINRGRTHSLLSSNWFSVGRHNVSDNSVHLREPAAAQAVNHLLC